MKNKILILLAKAVVTVVVFFICDSLFRYFGTGVVDYGAAARYAITMGVACFVVVELFGYYSKKKEQ